MTKTLIGHMGVDAGLCWIGDPCYVLGDDASHRVNSWDDFCDKLEINSRNWSEPLGANVGFAVATGYGDGNYPVYVHVEDGRVARITIDFFGDEDEEDEDG